ncbi:hypothetical protein M427DRAFT_48456 [Gonapodya prolifera JEL478]|uniref:Uncharacterized protein n=1 Tax=Gonapodya prolifera (strain JEL478) TaxID=1344416 RepID=A0A139A1F0_GONPJ|nr:hypothetical protein M427DRAFT_48456 [Gonapodya prolifera JEL478]|eukprot:KXS10365.1 hypothetical protein M427DRAFT_48456 [Gonapodya prolifera JEL478]
MSDGLGEVGVALVVNVSVRDLFFKANRGTTCAELVDMVTQIAFENSSGHETVSKLRINPVHLSLNISNLGFVTDYGSTSSFLDLVDFITQGWLLEHDKLVVAPALLIPFDDRGVTSRITRSLKTYFGPNSARARASITTLTYTCPISTTRPYDLEDIPRQIREWQTFQHLVNDQIPLIFPNLNSLGTIPAALPFQTFEFFSWPEVVDHGSTAFQGRLAGMRARVRSLRISILHEVGPERWPAQINLTEPLTPPRELRDMVMLARRYPNISRLELNVRSNLPLFKVEDWASAVRAVPASLVDVTLDPRLERPDRYVAMVHDLKGHLKGRGKTKQRVKDVFGVSPAESSLSNPSQRSDYPIFSRALEAKKVALAQARGRGGQADGVSVGVSGGGKKSGSTSLGMLPGMAGYDEVDGE